MKRKIVLLTILTICMFVLNGCQSGLKDLPNNPIIFSYNVITYEEDGTEFKTIEYGDKTYVIYGSLKPKGFIGDLTYAYGECLGYIGNNKNNRVYALKNESKDIWLIQYYINGVMDEPIVYKEVNYKGEDPECINPFDFN